MKTVKEWCWMHYEQYLVNEWIQCRNEGRDVDDLKELCAYLQSAPLTKAALIAWKEQLTGKYAPATVNSMLTATNGYLRFYGWCSCRRSCGSCCALTPENKKRPPGRYSPPGRASPWTEAISGGT